ncbi:hypothetical protein [Vibrio parahaemolyticus]|uniref:hypothetical protein n=1 Tax=Vibrio parahaemolyticus TaxID=670 RepID=UPI0004218F2D
MKMLLFRGQNEDTGFKSTQARHDNLGGDNGAVYFLGYGRRSSALAYALTNYKIFEDDLDFDEESEWVENGVLYQCQYKDREPKMLNYIPIDSICSVLPTVYQLINEIDDTLFNDTKQFSEYANNFDSVFDLIENINELRNDYELSKDRFDELISPIIDKCGTSIAIAMEDGEALKDEYLVYRTSDVKVLKVVPVYQNDILRLPISERRKLPIDAINKMEREYLDGTILSR